MRALLARCHCLFHAIDTEDELPCHLPVQPLPSFPLQGKYLPAPRCPGGQHEGSNVNERALQSTEAETPGLNLLGLHIYSNQHRNTVVM